MNKYVAYVSCYTQNNKYGISIFDVDVKKGRFTEKGKVEVSNSSYITISHNQKYLYSITDMGVESFLVKEDGSLKQLNLAPINGMRGCYISTSYDDKFLFVAGYHDGKITVLRIKSNGSIGEITEEIYLKGMGTVSERNFRPHVNCVKMSRDDNYLLAADPGMDHVNVYSLDHKTGKLKLADIIRCDQESAPRHIKFSENGKYLYVVHEMSSMIDVFEYDNSSPLGIPSFEKIQSVSTLNDYHTAGCAACCINLSFDCKYIIASNAGDNSISMFGIQNNGELKKLFCLPVSGEYPKDAALFPNNKYIVSCNNESDTLTFFSINPSAGTMVMNGPEIKIEKPNCIIFHQIEVPEQ